MPIRSRPGDLVESEPVSQSVVTLVADELGADPIELDPLYDTIDPDALDSLFEIDGSDTQRRSGSVEFSYADCAVTVRADGSVSATEIGVETD